MRYVLIRTAKLPLNPVIKTPQYLPRDVVSRTILVIYLRMDLLEKFNLNLGYILIRASDPNN